MLDKGSSVLMHKKQNIKLETTVLNLWILRMTIKLSLIDKCNKKDKLKAD